MVSYTTVNYLWQTPVQSLVDSVVKLILADNEAYLYVLSVNYNIEDREFRIKVTDRATGKIITDCPLDLPNPHHNYVHDDIGICNNSLFISMSTIKGDEGTCDEVTENEDKYWVLYKFSLESLKLVKTLRMKCNDIFEIIPDGDLITVYNRYATESYKEIKFYTPNTLSLIEIKHFYLEASRLFSLDDYDKHSIKVLDFNTLAICQGSISTRIGICELWDIDNRQLQTELPNVYFDNFTDHIEWDSEKQHLIVLDDEMYQVINTETQEQIVSVKRTDIMQNWDGTSYKIGKYIMATTIEDSCANSLIRIMDTERGIVQDKKLVRSKSHVHENYIGFKIDSAVVDEKNFQLYCFHYDEEKKGEYTNALNCAISRIEI